MVGNASDADAAERARSPCGASAFASRLHAGLRAFPPIRALRRRRPGDIAAAASRCAPRMGRGAWRNTARGVSWCGTCVPVSWR